MEEKGIIKRKAFGRLRLWLIFLCAILPQSNVRATEFVQNGRVSPAQKTVRLKGKVLDERKHALPGVSVRMKDTPLMKDFPIMMGTATDNQGRFTLSLPVAEGRLEFSFIGFSSQVVDFNEKSQRDSIIVILKEKSHSMDEVVVNGYQEINAKAMTGAYTKVNMDDLIMTGSETLETMLQGQVPGMVVTNPNGLTGTRQKVRVRGTSTLLGNAEPLWVVDGIIQEDPLPVESSSLATMDDNADMMKDYKEEPYILHEKNLHFHSDTTLYINSYYSLKADTVSVRNDSIVIGQEIFKIGKEDTRVLSGMNVFNTVRDISIEDSIVHRLEYIYMTSGGIEVEQPEEAYIGKQLDLLEKVCLNSLPAGFKPHTIFLGKNLKKFEGNPIRAKDINWYYENFILILSCGDSTVLDVDETGLRNDVLADILKNIDTPMFSSIKFANYPRNIPPDMSIVAVTL